MGRDGHDLRDVAHEGEAGADLAFRVGERMREGNADPEGLRQRASYKCRGTRSSRSSSDFSYRRQAQNLLFKSARRGASGNADPRGVRQLDIYRLAN
jgi:hypothetical protein